MEGKGIKLLLITESLIWFAWCAIILVFANYDKAGFYFWAGLICGTIAFGISVVSKQEYSFMVPSPFRLFTLICLSWIIPYFSIRVKKIVKNSALA